MNVRRKIEREVGKELGSHLRRQRMHVVEHERDRSRRLGQLAEQRGDRFARLDAATKRLARRRRAAAAPSERAVRAEQQRLDEATGVVVFVEREPGSARAGREPLAPEAREQRGLAVAGRRLHADQRALAHRMELAHEPLAAHDPASRARRRDLDREQCCRPLLFRHRAGEQRTLDKQARLARRRAIARWRARRARVASRQSTAIFLSRICCKADASSRAGSCAAPASASRRNGRDARARRRRGRCRGIASRHEPRIEEVAVELADAHAVEREPVARMRCAWRPRTSRRRPRRRSAGIVPAARDP